MKIIFAFVFIFVLLASCTDSSNYPPVADAKPIALKASQQRRIAQDNEFAFELFRKTLAHTNENNLMVSPLSVSMALGMTRNGAVGETLAGIEQTLFLSGLSDADINHYYKTMQTTLPTLDPTTTLNIANSIWYRKGYPVKTDFLNTSKLYFDAYVSELDFQKPEAKDSINKWVSNKTNKLIPDILDQIPADAVMYLVNAVYFKGSWRKKFDKKNTSLRSFTTIGGMQVLLNAMHAKDTFLYAETNDAQFVELNYGNKAFSMLVMLPNAKLGFANFVNMLHVGYLNSISQQLQSREVELYLPRFKSKNKLLLNQPLQQMGMSRAFEDRNEFSRITDNSIFVSRVLHDTFIEVTEEGTEAAAATVVEMREKAMMHPLMDVNRPFVYLIREKSTGIILFLGTVANPVKH